MSFADATAAALRNGAADIDARQQVRASQALLALGIYVVFSIIQHVEVWLGLIDIADSWPLVLWNLGGGVMFLALIRSGANLRIATDPALTMPQGLWAMVGIAWSYGITGAARGAVMLIMVLILVFGIFALRPAQARLLAAAGFAMLGVVMVYKGLTDPLRYDPRVEGLHMAIAGVVIASVSALAVRLGQLRSRLSEQRRELAQALARIQALATRDELTGLCNRRAVLDRMRAEVAVRDRQTPLMSVALIDLDNFKRINDNHGHAAGDTVLRRFAEQALSEVRAGDVLARWGGEEFLYVLPATDAATAAAALERLRRRLREVSFHDVGPGLKLTFSAGVAECRTAQDLDAAIERADAAMYCAKNAGRDRTVGPD